MKKTNFSSLMVLFAIVLTISMASASSIVNFDNIKVDGISVVENDIVAGFVSDTVPVQVEFTALKGAEDVRVKVYIEGYRDEISDQTARFNIIENSSYVKELTLTLPSSMDLDDSTESMTLIVRFSSKTDGSDEKEYTIKMQKDLYTLSFLSVDTPNSIVAGDVIAVDVVLKNHGANRLDDVYVKASIPELGIQRTVYFGDLQVDTEDEIDDDETSDTVNKRIYLTVPRNSGAGIYDIELEAYNYDSRVATKKAVQVKGLDAAILPTVTAKTIAVGEEATYEVVLVNPNDKMVVYSITPSNTEGLLVEVAEPIVTVSADSSRTVQVRVKATESAEEGTHIVTVNINSASGLVEQVSFSANVEASSKTATSSVMVLTVVLAIIFVVLLIVLIVLLTKKPTETEEFGETSYY